MASKITKVCVLVAVALFSMSGHAVTINLAGVNNGLNTATANVTYDGVDTLTVVLQNTSTSGPDPRITAFAFNTPTEITGINSFNAAGFAGSATWTDLFDINDIGTPGNFGDFDGAGVSGGNFQGGDPNDGISIIAPNNVGTFTFQFLGSNLNTLTVASFLNSFSDPQNNQSAVQNFAVRFQRTNLDGEGSDTALTQVPLPAAAWLFISGLAGLFGIKRFKRT